MLNAFTYTVEVRHERSPNAEGMCSKLMLVIQGLKNSTRFFLLISHSRDGLMVKIPIVVEIT